MDKQSSVDKVIAGDTSTANWCNVLGVLDAAAFAKWLNDEGACRESLKWQHGKTLRETWDTCQRGDWLEWLLNACGYQLTATAYEAYRKATATAYEAYRKAKAPAEEAYRKAKATAEEAYRKATAPAYEAYRKATAPAEEAYRKATAPAEEAYRKAKATAEEAYQKAKAPAEEAYQKAKATSIRGIIPYPFEKEGK